MFNSLKHTVGAVAAVAILIVCALAACAGLTLLALKIDGWLSAPRGATQQQVDTNTGTNRETAAATFSQLYQQIQAYKAQIAADTGQPTPSAMDAEDLLSAQAVCRQAVSQYDADLSTPVLRPWVPAGLPTTALPMTLCNPGH